MYACMYKSMLYSLTDLASLSRAAYLFSSRNVVRSNRILNETDDDRCTVVIDGCRRLGLGHTKFTQCRLQQCN